MIHCLLIDNKLCFFFLSFQVVSKMAEATIWQLCILCQKQTEEELVCPLANPVASRREEAYTEIISLASQFRAIGAAPHPDVGLPDEESMQKNRAYWHKSCRQMYRASALDHARKRYNKGLAPARKRFRRSHADVNRNLCIFCGDETNAADHSFQKITLTKQIHDKAVALGEDRIVALLAEGDLVAIEAKYHRNCYTGFNRRFDAICKQDTATENLEITTENELLQFIKEEVTGGRRIFPLQDLTDMMTERLEQHGIQKTVNRTRLKERILEHFPSLTEEKGIRDRVFIICSKTARKVISDATQTPDEEAHTLLMAASILRKAVVDHDTVFKFDGSFPNGCEESSVPHRIKYFFRQFLAGPKSSPEQENSRKILSVSQLAMLNMTSLSTNLCFEPPLAVFLALKLHSQTRSKKLVELLHKYSLSVSYKKVLSIESRFAQAISDHARNNADIVCPTNLHRGIFTVAALDNLDHNPTSRTASSSFHGTGISIFQFPSSERPGLDQERLQFNLQKSRTQSSKSTLPQSYTFVPPVGRTLVTQPPVKYVQPMAMSSFDEEKQHEQAWMAAVDDTLYTDCDTENTTPAMWSSYHAARSDTVGQPEKCVEALLPLFHEKAATAEMIRHGMELVKKITEHLNPHQVPVLVVDQPLYDLSKKMQWTFPDNFGEDKFVVMLGGLHIEMALWSTMGELLRGSGWPETLKKSGLVKTEAAATAFLKASNVMRTRYAHQVTVTVLDSLLKRAYKDSGTDMALEDWVVIVSQQSPTFKFWLLVHRYQQIIFMFIRAHRERKIELMVTTLKKLVPLFFALDHHNYARWTPIFIRDLEGLPDSIREEFKRGNWTITRSNRRFSSLPIDQAHEQANKRVKGVGGIIGLTENRDLLERWIMTGPEISRVVEEFTGENDKDDEEELPHHEEGYASQQRFVRHVKDLLEELLSNGNPFEEHSEDLVTLDNKVCESAAATLSVHLVESMGQEQYNNFRQSVLDSNYIPLTAPIKRNNLLLFHEKKTQKKTAVKRKMQHFKRHAELYGQAFLVLDSRGGDLQKFFQHESSPYPPALSSEGSLNSCTKSDLLVYIMESSTSSAVSVQDELLAPDVYDFIIIDGGALIHSLPSATVQGKTFDSYFDKVFCPRVRHDLNRSTRVDIVWDQYHTLTIKGNTREKRGTGTRQRISGTAKIPGNWQNFLANIDNKKELFSFLSKKIAEEYFPDDKNVYITAGDQVHHVGNSPPMNQCNHEEADTRVLVHLLHALQSSPLGMVYTGDTDVVVILLTNFHHIKALNPDAEIWISFKAGKTTKMISLNTIATNLGSTTCKAMALFHAFTGTDSTSSFKFKGKRSCCALMTKVPSLMEEFATIVNTPFQASPRLKEVAINFVCKLYSSESNEDNDVDLVRMRLFSQKTRDVERIPPTKDALLQHLKRSVFQASIWATAHMSMMPANNPTNHGWKEEDGKLLPIWTTLPLAKDVFHLDVKCTCTVTCSRCKCVMTKLKCTRQCKCTCEK